MKKFFYVIMIVFIFLLQNTCFCKAYNLADIDKAMTASEYKSKTKVDDMDTVWFGDYYDTGENSYKLIEWVVLEKQNDKALLLSKNVLDCKNYNDDENDKNVSWENCSLRAWLNTVFIDKAFDEKKNNGKKMILDTNLETHGLSENKTEDNVSYTTDKIFVLSDDEITKYLDKESRISKATIYAKNVDNNGKKLQVKQLSPQFGVEYWLRDAGGKMAKNIMASGTILHHSVGYNRIGVRPALWVDLSTKNDYKLLTVPPKDETSKNQLAKQLKSIKPLNEYKNIETVENIKTVTFGNYMQTNENGSTKDPIDWIVLDKKDDKVLLLSKYILDNKQYHFESVDTTWKNCDLRKWLNNSFYNEAFNENEKKQIINMNIENGNNVKFDTTGGSNTVDKIFVLSESDIKQYFRKTNVSTKFSVLSTKATRYARNQKNIAGYGLLVDDNSNSYYYLRTPGKFQNHAMIVLTDKSFDREGVVVSNYCGIRPAMWVSLTDTDNNVDDANKKDVKEDILDE